MADRPEGVDVPALQGRSGPRPVAVGESAVFHRVGVSPAFLPGEGVEAKDALDLAGSLLVVHSADPAPAGDNARVAAANRLTPEAAQHAARPLLQQAGPLPGAIAARP